jgi:delta14-sterol reductase
VSVPPFHVASENALHANIPRIGGGFLIVFLPILVYIFAFFCNDVSGTPPPALLHPSTLTLDKLKTQVGWREDGINGLFDAQVTLYVLGYYLLLVVMQVVLPGTEVKGVELACGGKLVYKFNSTLLLLLLQCHRGAQEN